MFGLQFRLAFVRPDRLARFDRLLHLGLQYGFIWDSLSSLTSARKIKIGVDGADMGLREAYPAAHDVGVLDERHAFVIGDAAAQTHNRW